MHLEFFPWCEAREKAHALRQFVDVDGLAHLQDKRLSASSLPGSAQDEVHSLGDGHKKPGCPGVGYVQRLSLLDVVPEKPQNAPRATRHVSEPHIHEPRGVFGGKVLDAELGQLFGKAHVVFGVYRFVRRDVYEPLYTMVKCSNRHVSGAQHVVSHGFARMKLEESNMFVSRRVEHERRPVETKCVVDTAREGPIDE